MKQDLITALEQLGPERTWRPVTTSDGTLLNNGQGDGLDGIPEDSPIHFTGKTVIDLGCNIGAFTFLAAQRGAAMAAGTDIVPEAIAVCNILRQQNNLPNTAFFVSDIVHPEPAGRFDMAMLIDIIGKEFILKELVSPLVRTMAAYARHELVMTFRPVYFLDDAFGDKAHIVANAYPPPFIRDGKFLLHKYVQHLLGPAWHMQTISNEPDMERKYKYLFHALRVG